MAYSSTDLTNVEAAITALISGDQIVEITKDGITTRYNQTSLDKLISLREDIKREVNVPAASSGVSNPRTVVSMSRKGL